MHAAFVCISSFGHRHTSLRVHLCLLSFALTPCSLFDRLIAPLDHVQDVQVHSLHYGMLQFTDGLAVGWLHGLYCFRIVFYRALHLSESILRA